MTQRATTSDAAELDGAPVPDLGERVVVETNTRRTISREAEADRAPEAPLPPHEEHGAEEYDDGGPEPWTLERFLRQLDGNTSATVIVRRKPDSFQQRNLYRVPCAVITACQSVRLEPGMTPDDVYQIVREQEGSGGNYSFQIRYGSGFLPVTWEQTLSDPPAAQASALARQAPAAAEVAQQQPAAAQTAAPAQPDDPVRRAFDNAYVKSIGKLMERALDPQQPNAAQSAQPDTTDPADKFLQMLAKAEEFKKALGVGVAPAGEPWYADVLRTFGNGIATALGPLAPMLLMKLMSQPNGQQQEQQPNSQQQGGEQQQQQQYPEPFNSILRVLVEDATRNAPVGRAADAICGAVNAQPELYETLRQIVALPGLQMVETVAKLSGAAYLTQISYGVEWFEALREEVIGRFSQSADEGAQAEGEGEPGAEGEPASA